MKKKTLLLALIYVSFLSCETVVDADELMDSQEKIFINGYLAPSNEFIEISVTRTQPLHYGRELLPSEHNNSFYIIDAIVTLSDGEGETILLHYSEEKSVYEIATDEFPITGGKKYFLNVKIENKEYTSSCTIPPDQEVTEIEPVIRGSESSSTLNVRFRDLLDEQNFYIVNATASSYPDDTNNNWNHLGLQSFQTDGIHNGGIITTTDGNLLFSVSDRMYIDIKVAHVEEIMYNFLRAMYVNNWEATENLFVESMVPPTNIYGENAMGVFAGYQITEKQIIYEESK